MIIAKEIRKLSDIIQGKSKDISVTLQSFSQGIHTTGKSSHENMDTFERLGREVAAILEMLLSVDNDMDRLSELGNRIYTLMEL